MSTKVNLSKLERVPLREAWKHEAGDFTPWLAEVSVTLLPAGTAPAGGLASAGRVNCVSMKRSRRSHQYLSQATSPL